MRKSVVKDNVGDFGTIHAKELTVAEFVQLNSAGGSVNPVLDNMLARHQITVAALNVSLGIKLRDAEVAELRIHDKCDGCRLCIETRCPVSGYNFYGQAETETETDPDSSGFKIIPLLSKDSLQHCAGCGQCVDVCPNNVFEVVFADYTFSDLEPLIDIFHEVNPDFFLMKEFQEKQQKENIEFIRWDLQKESGKNKRRASVSG